MWVLLNQSVRSVESMINCRPQKVTGKDDISLFDCQIMYNVNCLLWGNIFALWIWIEFD